MQLDAHVSFLGGETKLPNIDDLRWSYKWNSRDRHGFSWQMWTWSMRKTVQRRSLICSWSSVSIDSISVSMENSMGLTKSKPLGHRRELTATKKVCNIGKDKSIGTFPSKPSAWVISCYNASQFVQRRPSYRNFMKLQETSGQCVQTRIQGLPETKLHWICHFLNLFAP